MDDNRIAWIKNRVLKGLSLRKESLFEDLLIRNDYEVSKELRAYLDNPMEANQGALLFYSQVLEVEEETEMVEG
jgi:hypothetical protein